MSNKEPNRPNLMDNLRALRPLLPKGYTKLIAKDCDTTEVTVSNALQGKTKRFDIIERAIELAEENRKIMLRLQDVVK